jgi:hypothetical protein
MNHPTLVDRIASSRNQHDSAKNVHGNSIS